MFPITNTINYKYYNNPHQQLCWYLHKCQSGDNLYLSVLWHLNFGRNELFRSQFSILLMATFGVHHHHLSWATFYFPWRIASGNPHLGPAAATHCSTALLWNFQPLPSVKTLLQQTAAKRCTLVMISTFHYLLFLKVVLDWLQCVVLWYTFSCPWIISKALQINFLCWKTPLCLLFNLIFYLYFVYIHQLCAELQPRIHTSLKLLNLNFKSLFVFFNLNTKCI